MNSTPKKMIWEIIIGAVVAWGVSGILKIIIHAPRPFVEQNLSSNYVLDAYASFPSAHAAVAFAIATVIFYHSKKWWGIVAATIAAAIAISRVVIGVHYPRDIIAGALLGVVAASLVHILIFKKSK